jgi:hypothetical protein
MRYIDIETIITMFRSTYKNSYLRGDEIARILQVRYGDDESDEQSKVNASYRSGSGLDSK